MIKLFTPRFRYEKAFHRKQSFTFTPNSINNYRTRMTISKSFLQLGLGEMMPFILSILSSIDFTFHKN